MRRRILVIALGAVLLVLAAGAGGLYAYDSSRSDVIANGITMGGIDVGGRGANSARKLLRDRLGPKVWGGAVGEGPHRRWRLEASDADVHVNVDRMVREALRRSRDGNFFDRAFRDLSGGKVEARLPMRVAYSPDKLHAFIDGIAKQVSRQPVSATINPNGFALNVTPSREGRAVRKRWLARRILRQLRDPNSVHVALVPTRTLRPHVSLARLAYKYPTFITIYRSGFSLRLWKKLKLVRTYTIAVGRIGLETPAGLYHIDDKQVNPSWHVPNSSWAGALAGQVIPPGPEDPLKARWMGFYDGAGIHGTDDLGSLGTAASHGCVRMSVPDVIELYDQVPLGTPIYIGN